MTTWTKKVNAHILKTKRMDIEYSKSACSVAGGCGILGCGFAALNLCPIIGAASLATIVISAIAMNECDKRLESVDQLERMFIEQDQI